ncbi:MAG: DUF5666 domain-containing protein [bacterium]|nr:DUF5666 domain-containing protein [bacterium]
MSIVLALTLLLAAGGYVLAKNDNAPGQQNQDQGSSHGNGNSNGNSNGNGNAGSQNQGNSQSSQGSQQSNSGNGSSKKLTNAELKLAKKEEQQLKKEAKLGAMGLKDLLEKLSSDSSSFDRSIGRVTKVRVTTASTSAQMKRHAVEGVITEVGDGVLTIAHQIQRDRVYTIIIDDLTVIAMKGKDTATFADLVVGQRIAVVGEPTENGLHAKRVHVIPGKATGIFQKQPLATPSGMLTTTPSATDAAIPSSTPSPSATPTIAL